MPRKPQVVDDLEGAITGNEYDSNVLKFRKALTPIIGADHYIYLSRRDTARLSKLAVGPLRMRPLRWSNLTADQQRLLEEIVPVRGTDDLVSYGDTVVMLCPLAQYEKVVRRRMLNAHTTNEAKLTADSLSRETGLPIDERWEDLPASHAPRS